MNRMRYQLQSQLFRRLKAISPLRPESCPQTWCVEATLFECFCQSKNRSRWCLFPVIGRPYFSWDGYRERNSASRVCSTSWYMF